MAFEDLLIGDKLLSPSGRYLLHLIACGLHGREPGPLPAGASWERVHDLASWNSVGGVSWAGARHRAHEMPEALARAWAADADTTLWRRLQFDTERERVLAALADAGFSYLPLKGVLIAPMYPDPSMRAMADNDILYGRIEPDPAGGYRVRGANEGQRAETVRRGSNEVARVMADLGYKTSDPLGLGNHDAFERAPIFNFELHRSLFLDSDSWIGPFANPWALAVPDAPGSPAYHFEPSDFYAYLIGHAYKHFEAGGTGIRSAVDEFVELGHMGSSLDRDRVDAVLSEMGLTEFEACLRAASLAAFGEGACEPGGPALDPDADALLAFMMRAGTYGTTDIATERKLERESERLGKKGRGLSISEKLAYLWRRIKMPEQERLAWYPVLGRYKVLRPAFYVARVVKIFRKLPKVTREVRRVREYGE